MLPDVDFVLDPELETLALCDALTEESSDFTLLAEMIESSDDRGLEEAEVDVSGERDACGVPLKEVETLLVPDASALPVMRALAAAD